MTVERVSYKVGHQEFIGAWVKAQNTPDHAPLILVSPNWLGVTDGAIKQAVQIAADKHIVFVADMYGAGKAAEGPQDAAPLADGLRQNWQERRARIFAAYETMLATSRAKRLGDKTRTAAMGFCFGGGNVLELARTGASAKAFICLHGDLITPVPAAAGDIKGKLLVAHGAADPVSPKAQRDAFEAEMSAAGASWAMLTFGAVVHSFAEEGPPVPGIAEYEPRAAKLTFEMIDAFLEDAWMK